jgi:hypothetical protein
MPGEVEIERQPVVAVVAEELVYWLVEGPH